MRGVRPSSPPPPQSDRAAVGSCARLQSLPGSRAANLRSGSDTGTATATDDRGNTGERLPGHSSPCTATLLPAALLHLVAPFSSLSTWKAALKRFTLGPLAASPGP
eukprot:229971-Rhodomonas_salina.3